MSDSFKPLDIRGDMQRREEEMHRIIAETQEMEREKDKKIGVHGLNDKVAALLDVLVHATKASDAATAENLRLQQEVRDLTVDLKTLTVRLKTLTVWAIIFAAFAVLCAAGQVYYGKVSYSLALKQSQAASNPPPTK